MPYSTLVELIDHAQANEMPLWRAVRELDAEEKLCAPQAIEEKMEALWDAMLAAADGYEKDRVSASGLSGGDGGKMQAYRSQGNTLGGDFVAQVMAQALEMGESNACMKCIVAAPTAGSCGVLPAVLVPLYRAGASRRAIVEALFVAGGIGAVIARRATISGAEGGCQAEVGAASAMAAGAAVSLRGGSPEQVAHAVAMALKNLLGLICDPVAGLVEVPCVKRNVIGAVNAVAAADMALAGIESRIPADEVIDAMGRVGREMPLPFRETAQGGLAVTPTGCEIQSRLRNE